MIQKLSPPPRNDKDLTSHNWQDWFFKLWDWLMANYPSDFFFEIVRGNIPNTRSWHQFARSIYNTNGVENDVWGSPAGSKKTWRTAAAKLEVVSSSASDAVAGGGATKVLIRGLDANFNEIEETVTLTGAVASPVGGTTNSFLRVNQTIIVESEAYASGATSGANVGLITTQGVGGGTVESYILAGKGECNNSHFTIPSGYTGYINRMSLNVSATKSATFELYMRSNADDVTTPFSPKLRVHAWDGITGAFQEETKLHFPIPAKTDLWLTATPGANDTILSSDYDIILVRTS